MALSHSVRALLPWKILVKELIESLVIDSEKLQFVSSFTVYEDNNGALVCATSPRMTTTSKNIWLVLPSMPAVNAGQRRRTRPRDASVAKPLASA